MKHQLSELIDLPELQMLMESLYRATGINHALIDNDSQVLTAVGWKTICTDFHRVNPATCRRCQESDRHILSHLHDGPYVGYDCLNGLVDYATPVIIEGEHVANIFTGQMFHTPPDMEFFQRQAKEFGFDEERYLEAIQQVPIVPRERMPHIMDFLVGLAQMLGRKGLTRLRQLDAKMELRQLNAELADRVLQRTKDLDHKNRQLSQEIIEHEQTEAALRESENRHRLLVENSPLCIHEIDLAGKITSMNTSGLLMMGVDQEYRVCGLSYLDVVSTTDRDRIEGLLANAYAGETSQFEFRASGASERDFKSCFAPIKNKTGDVIRLMGITEDITERKQAAAEREQYFQFFDTSSDLMCIADPNGCFRKINPACIQALGYSEAELLSKPFIDFVHPDDQQSTLTEVARQIQHGLSFNFENRYLCKDGTFLWMSWRAYLNQDEGLTYATARDITERKRWEDTLKEAEYRWKFALEGAGDGVWDWNIQSNMVSFSKRWEEMIGYASGDFEHRIENWKQHLHPDDRPHVLAVLQDYLDDQSSIYTVEFRLRCKDDSWKWILSRGMAVQRDANGKPSRMIGTHADITASKLAEEAIRIESKKNETLLNTASDGIHVMDIDGHVVQVNEAFCRMLGYTEEQLLAMNVAQFDMQWSGEELNALITDLLKDGNPSVFETRHRRRDGQIIQVEINANSVAINGKPFIYASARDVTERKRAEAELVLAKATADHANNAKSRFLAAASHDLRQPLSALELYFGVLKNGISPKLQELVSNMQDCIDSLSELLTDLLDTSKLDAGVVRLEPVDFALDELLAELVSIHAISAQRKGLRLRTRGIDAVVHTDHTLLQRMLSNLITNAIRYTSMGGVLIACRRRLGKLWVEVWDTGIGIPSEQTGIIFEEFTQLGDGARTQGSGLGLSIVAKAAALLGLEIRVSSRLGRGSMFAIEVPLAQAVVHVEPMTTPPATSALRVALVEDNPKVLDAMVMALECFGHEVIAATSGAELLEHLGDRVPHIVISDYRLDAGETGFDVISAVRASFGEYLPAIIITGDTDPALLRSMTGQGIAIHHKPLRIDALQQHIREATE